jgi:hypothetical protein
MIKHVCILAFLSLAVTACDEAPTPTPKSDTTTKATSKPTGKATGKAKDSGTKAAKTDAPDAEEKADPAMDDEDIPVAADFEEKAEKEITKDNADAEFSKLEKEVKGE